MTSRPTSAARTAAAASASDVSVVSAPSESTSTVRWPSLPARSTAARIGVVQGGAPAQREGVDDVACSVAVVGQHQRGGDLAGEGDDADEHVVGHQVEEVAGGLLGRGETRTCHRVAGVDREHRAARRTVPSEPADAAVAATVSPADADLDRGRVDVGAGRHRDQQRDRAAVGGGLGVRDRRLGPGPVGGSDAGAAQHQQPGQDPSEESGTDPGEGTGPSDPVRHEEQRVDADVGVGHLVEELRAAARWPAAARASGRRGRSPSSCRRRRCPGA